MFKGPSWSPVFAKCRSMEVDLFWSPAEMTRLDSTSSPPIVRQYEFTIPQNYDPPTADEIRRAVMREVTSNSAAILLDKSTVLLAGSNAVARDFSNASNLMIPISGGRRYAAGMLQTIKGVERLSCAKSRLGGYDCKFLIDVDMRPNAAAASLDYGPLSALASAFSRQGPVELNYRFRLTNVGWRSKELGEEVAQSDARTMNAFYNGNSKAAAGAKSTLCSIGNGDGSLWSGPGCK